ncbi:outer membrane lipoprotein carrier protein LolA [Panacibacter ginsenosidivorans]|uniref:Outer membrane lipoprotein carrier protein LolA n=1 Tax=Panacibacter ginsenosidivorans TaxID=1813871 RepID=A0A5B8V8W0_9BACT|nr:outer membrane lipoprotein carrier protein LolA [Panacibacter ginsenosidivorans]QEC67353.1 outer membrane lipoprotein carrier protein LolA [Panacibacter ginsenosidivorans]
MKKVYLLLLLIIGFNGIANAQNDPNAKKVLDEVSAKLKTLKGVIANFSYTTKDRNKALKGSAKGIINIKGQKYYLKQGATEIFCDGVKVWNYNGEDEVTVADVDNEDTKMLTPQKLLSNFYDQDFTYKLISSAGPSHEIVMYPTDKRKNFKQVTVYVDKTKKMILKAQVIDKSDNIIEFSLTNVSTTAALADSKFVFDAAKHPGVEVVTQ